MVTMGVIDKWFSQTIRCKTTILMFSLFLVNSEDQLIVCLNAVWWWWAVLLWGPGRGVLVECAGARPRFAGREPWKPPFPNYPCQPPPLLTALYCMHHKGLSTYYVSQILLWSFKFKQNTSWHDISMDYHMFKTYIVRLREACTPKFGWIFRKTQIGVENITSSDVLPYISTLQSSLQS